MANKADLMNHKGRWYFSKAYPKELWPIKDVLRCTLGKPSGEGLHSCELSPSNVLTGQRFFAFELL